jgi:hypothetical protein
MTAIDAKPPKQRFDQHPHLKRQAKPKVALDDIEAHLVLPEKEYRELLFRDFVKFCREHDAFVVSVPWRMPARVLVPLGDGETSRLEIALQQLPKYRVVKLPNTAARLSHGVFETMRELEVRLWRDN